MGVLFVLLALASAVLLFFVQFPGQQSLPWVNLLLTVLAVAFVVLGLRRAITEPQRFRGKIAGWVFTVLSVLLLALNTFGFYEARHLPDGKSAPAVGQKAPDFELRDTNGQTISLAELLSRQGVPGKAAPTKAVLLVFYRGYW
jgi:drug/metabolite transporter (DMT)-like permease